MYCAQIRPGKATERRAAPFYRTLGYEESATYFRKVAGSKYRQYGPR